MRIGPPAYSFTSRRVSTLDEMAIPRRKAIKNRSVGGGGEKGEHNNFMAQ